MKIAELLTETGAPYFIYYDYTGAGRGPEQIAGPFDNAAAAEEYAAEAGWSMIGGNYFIDVEHK